MVMCTASELSVGAAGDVSAYSALVLNAISVVVYVLIWLALRFRKCMQRNGYHFFTFPIIIFHYIIIYYLLLYFYSIHLLSFSSVGGRRVECHATNLLLVGRDHGHGGGRVGFQLPLRGLRRADAGKASFVVHQLVSGKGARFPALHRSIRRRRCPLPVKVQLIIMINNYCQI